MTRIQILKLSALLCLMFSCTSRYPDDVKSVLKKSGQNKKELIKAIDYFEDIDDEQMLKAVYYLIAGMKNKFSYTGEAYKLLNEEIIKSKSLIDSLKNNNKFKTQNKILKQLRKKLTLRKLHEFVKIEDCKIITSKYIIKNVELAFEAWQMPWSKNVTFDQFCEYILPYKIGDEFITNWREKVLED